MNAKPEEVAKEDKRREKAMDYEKLVDDLRAACYKVQAEVNEIWQLVPHSLAGDVREFYESLTWGDFSLPASPKEKAPYLVWSLQTIMPNMQFFVRLCDHGGEFGFFPLNPSPIYRRTPAGWGAQGEMLVDMLAYMEKRMESPDDIPNIFQRIPRLCAEVPARLQAFIFDKIGDEAKFFFQCALNLTAAFRREREHMIAEENLSSSAEREMWEIVNGLRGTKSFAKSKVLRALRERCEKLAARLDPNPYKYDC